MKLVTMAVALLGAAEATKISIGSLEGNRIYAKQESMINNALKKADQDGDNHLAQLVTTALAGAPPGEINEPVVNADTVEGALTTTNGHTYRNYQYFWKFVCAFTKWVPTNQFLNAGNVYNE